MSWYGLSDPFFPSIFGAEFPALTDLFIPILLYGGCALGAVGVCLALPRRGTSPQVLGGLIAAVAVGAIFLAIGLVVVNPPVQDGVIGGWGERGGLGGLPNFNFYIFSFIALGAALRVISHPRPVYAALYFVLTILASSGLYLLLSAEFMTFALVIVYAGAILITYLFVIMLATESPSADQADALAEYDRFSREPIFATITGFVVVAVLVTLFARGAHQMPSPTKYAAASRLADLPKKVEQALHEAKVIRPGEVISRDESGKPIIDTVARTALVVPSPDAKPAPGEVWEPRTVELPASLQLSNTEGVAFSLLSEHPGAIEMAGVVLLMAMLGAVVLARKKVEMDEAARRAAAARQLTGDQAGLAGRGAA